MPTPRLSALVLSFGLGSVACVPAAARRGPAPATPPATAPTAGAPAGAARVGNDIRWFRAAAERRAAYLQAYALAGGRVHALATGRAPGTWAVILDADETVLDNSPYQQERALLDSGFTPASWHVWVERRAAAALPGSAAFIAAVRARGGRAVIVTNRAETDCPATRDTFARLGIAVDAVLCQTGTGDKNPRFDAVAAGTTGVAGLPPLAVVLWVGDNIQDFPAFTQAAARLAPDSAFADFGRRFVVLPNPMYGSWERNPLP